MVKKASKAANNTDAEPQAAEENAGAPLSNFDRLRVHLVEDSLAAKLLDAYRARDSKTGSEDLLKVLTTFKTAQDSDDTATGPKN